MISAAKIAIMGTQLPDGAENRTPDRGSEFGRDDQRNAEDEAEEHDEEQRPCPFGSLAEFTPDKDAPDRGNESRALPESVGNGG